MAVRTSTSGTPAVFLDNDSIRSPRVFPFEDVQYQLTVSDPNGCLAFDDIFVNVDANRNVYIPNAFSPDGDGRNDDMRVFACQGVTQGQPCLSVQPLGRLDVRAG